MKGEKGVAGLKGDRGPIGITGGIGASGPKGERGMEGVKGDRGQTGTTGLPGANGERGRVGTKGDRGPTGTKGSTGSQGVRGSRGLTGPPGSPAPIVGGVTYNRWGNSNCRSGVERVYPGRTGVTLHDDRGGAANYLCMPNDPQYTLPFEPGVRGQSYVFGTEYEEPLVSGHDEHNAPCAVCYIPTKHAVIMIPAKTSCPSGWTREYYGYLMSERRSSGRTMYVCVDIAREYIPGSQNHIGGGHFYHVEAHCNGFACPPYSAERELGCVVCSK